MVWEVRKESRANFRFMVEVTNISDYDIESGSLVGGFGDYLSKTGTDVKEMLDIQVVLVTTTNKSTIRVGCFQTVVVGTNVFN